MVEIFVLWTPSCDLKINTEIIMIFDGRVILAENIIKIPHTVLL
jgi:hypothetical protein